MRTLRITVAALMIASFFVFPFVNDSSGQAQADGARKSAINGTLSAASLNACALLEAQETLEVEEQSECGTTFHEVLLEATPDIKLYVRYGQRVEVRDGQIIADYKDESASPYKKVTLEPPYRGGTYYIALSNCAQTPAAYDLYFAAAVVDYIGPFIKTVSVKGKKLKVSGCYFDVNAVLLMNGEEVPVSYTEEDEMPTIVAKKAGRKISPGETVFLQVRNSNGSMSQSFAFTRGAE